MSTFHIKISIRRIQYLYIFNKLVSMRFPIYMAYCEIINCFTTTGIGTLDYWYDPVLKYSVPVSKTQ
jgi:hypothetical protein